MYVCVFTYRTALLLVRGIRFTNICTCCTLQAWYEKTPLGKKRAKAAKGGDEGNGKKGKDKKKGKKKK